MKRRNTLMGLVRLSAIIAGVTLLAMTTSAKPAKPSQDMILILIHHKSGDHELDPKELSLAQGMSFPSKTQMAEYELYVVPYPQGVADIFEFRVLLHLPSGRYWIHKMGGVGGVNEFYGPGEVKTLRK